MLDDVIRESVYCGHRIEAILSLNGWLSVVYSREDEEGINYVVRTEDGYFDPMDAMRAGERFIDHELTR